MNIQRFAASASLVVAMSLQPSSGFAADSKYSSTRPSTPVRPTVPFNKAADPPRSTTQFNNAANQKPYSGLKPVPMSPEQKEAIRNAFKQRQTGVLKNDFSAQADRKGPYTALKKTEQGGGASQTGKGKSEARVDSPKPFGGGPSFTSTTSRSDKSPRR